MFSIRRSLARQLGAVCRRAFGVAGCRKLELHFQAAESDLVIRAASSQVALEYHLSGSFEIADFTLPCEVLAACEAKTDDPVDLRVASDGTVTACWLDHGIPHQVVSAKRPTKLSEFPSRPAQMTANEPGTLRALADASETTDSESTRYALGCINLRGPAGSLAATNGRQLLVQNGFRFPWKDDVLVPASKLFAAREFPQETPV